VPFKFSYVMDEYLRQLCVKAGKVIEDLSYSLSKEQTRLLAE